MFFYVERLGRGENVVTEKDKTFVSYAKSVDLASLNSVNLFSCDVEVTFIPILVSWYLVSKVADFAIGKAFKASIWVDSPSIKGVYGSNIGTRGLCCRNLRFYTSGYV